MIYNKDIIIKDFLNILENREDKKKTSILLGLFLKDKTNSEEKLQIILKHTIEDILGYNKDNIHLLTFEELEMYGFYYLRNNHKDISTFLFNYIDIYDIVNFIYKDFYSDEDIVKIIYKKALKQNNGRILKSLFYRSKNPELFFHYCLEVLFTIHNIDINDDKSIIKFINKHNMRKYLLHKYIYYLYDNYEELLKRQFNI